MVSAEVVAAVVGTVAGGAIAAGVQWLALREQRRLAQEQHAEGRRLKIIEIEYSWLRQFLGDCGQALRAVELVKEGQIDRAGGAASLHRLRDEEGMVRRYPRLAEAYDAFIDAVTKLHNAEGPEVDDAKRVAKRRYRRLLEISYELRLGAFEELD